MLWQAGEAQALDVEIAHPGVPQAGAFA